jgi:hypothetical protein
LRGISRASYHASLFVAAFVAVGTVVRGVAAVFIDDDRNLNVATGSPSEPRWRQPRVLSPGLWRAWPSAVLAVGANWAGALLILPAVERSISHRLAPFFVIGVAVFLTNASVAIAWALPPWR